MSFKTTGVLLVILAALGGYVYLYPPPENKEPERERPPYVWEVDLSDIRHLDITYQDKLISMDWNTDKSQWEFLPESAIQGTIDQIRVNGIRLLLTGPGSPRKLTAEQAQDPTQFGLDRPMLVANVWDKDNNKWRVLVGDTTPNGQNHYIQMEGSPEVWLVDQTWAKELARFVTEPPLAKEDGEASGS